MRIIKNKLLKLLILLCTILPLNAMFTQNTFKRLQQIKAKNSAQTQQRLFTRQNNNQNYTPNIKIGEIPKTNNVTFSSWLSGWWNKPIVKKNTDVIIAELYTDKSTESNFPKEQIKIILESNNSDDITNAFNYIFKTETFPHNILEPLTTRDQSIQIKMLPAINATLSGLQNPLSRGDVQRIFLLKYFSKIILNLSENIDPAQVNTINEIKDKLLQLLDQDPFYTNFIDTALLLILLPNDTESFIKKIDEWEETMDKYDISGQLPWEQTKGLRENFIQKMSFLLQAKANSEKNKNNKEKLYLRMTQIKESNALRIIKKVIDIPNEDMNTISYRDLTEKAHLIMNALPEVITDPNVRNMITVVLHKEKELNDHGYETFYHGRRSEYNFVSDIYSMLYESQSGKKLDDFIFTHLDDPVLGKVDPRFFESEGRKLKRLREKGRDPLSDSDMQSLVFLNKSLFGNIETRGSCTMYYVLKNVSESNISFSPKEIFAMFGKSKTYKKFELQLLNLQKEHAKLSNYGELLMLAIPKKKVNDFVYHASAGGSVVPFEIPNVGFTTNTEEIINYLNKNPQDKVEFVAINAKKGGVLDPDLGIKVFSFSPGDPKKLAAFKEKEKALFDKIRQSLKEEGAIFSEPTDDTNLMQSLKQKKSKEEESQRFLE